MHDRAKHQEARKVKNTGNAADAMETRDSRLARNKRQRTPGKRGDDMASKATVLIVDDDPAIRKMITEVLSLEGYPLETASGGQQALDILADGRPRVVLLDLLMDPVNGWDVVHELESQGAARNRHRIILVSAIGTLEKHNYLKADGKLVKPFTVDQLINAIEAVGVPA